MAKIIFCHFSFFFNDNENEIDNDNKNEMIIKMILKNQFVLILNKTLKK
jgi:hypothetical protein